MNQMASNRLRMSSTGASSSWRQTQNIDVAEVLRGLSSTEAEQIMHLTKDRSYAPRTCIFSFGDQQQGLYLVKKGLVEEFRLTENGNRLPMNRIGPGKLFGLSSVEERYCCFAETVDESVIGFLSFQTLEDLCRKFPRTIVKMIELLARRLGEIEARLELLTFNSLRARVAWSLLGLYTNQGPHLTGITHEVLGEWAASSRPKVSMVLEELQRANLLRLSRAEIEVLDPIALGKWAKQAAESP